MDLKVKAKAFGTAIKFCQLEKFKLTEPKLFFCTVEDFNCGCGSQVLLAMKSSSLNAHLKTSSCTSRPQ